MTRADSPRAISMQTSLTRALSLVALLAVTASLLAVIATGTVLLRAYAQRNLELLTEQAAYSAEVAIVFNDAAAARDAVRPITEADAVTSVTIRGSDGEVMIAERNSESRPMRIFGHYFDPAPVTVPIRTTGQSIGSITLTGRTIGVGTLLIGSLLGAIAALIVAFAGTRLIGYRLQRTIVEPLQDIAAAAHSVRDHRSLSQRAPRARVTEVDDLALDFNALLDELASWQQQVSTAHEALIHRANFDGLSGLPNRARFVEAVRDAIKLSQRSDDRFAILFMDGDKFKATNDRFGHAAGDRVIAEIAARLSPLLRVGDMAARLGGDEFAVLIHHLEDVQNAEAVIARIKAAMAQPITLPGDDRITVGLSIGMAIYPDHGSEVDTLIASADAAMYAAKNAKKAHSAAPSTTLPPAPPE